MKKTFVSRTMTCLAALLMLTGGWRTDAAYLADALNEVYEVNIDTQNRPFAWPIPDSNSISSCFKDGREHNAIDIPAPQGTRVNAAADGVVTVAATGCTHNYGKSKSCGCNNGAGNYIMIRHDIGGTTYYDNDPHRLRSMFYYRVGKPSVSEVVALAIDTIQPRAMLFPARETESDTPHEALYS